MQVLVLVAKFLPLVDIAVGQQLADAQQLDLAGMSRGDETGEIVIGAALFAGAIDLRGKAPAGQAPLENEVGRGQEQREQQHSRLQPGQDGSQ